MKRKRFSFACVVQPSPATNMDEGFSWVVCMASFLILLTTVGQQNCSGIIFVALLDEFKLDRGVTAWVTSLAVSLALTFSPLSAFLCQRFGCRVTAMLGGTISATSLMISAFTTNLFALYVTYGVILGLGNSLCYTSSVIVLTLYFRKRLALATALSFLGPSIGIFLLTPFLKFLFQALELRYVFLVLAGVQVIVVLAAVAFRPVPISKRTRPSLDCSPFRNKGFVIWLVSLCLFIPGILTTYAHIVRFAEDIGIKKSQGSFIVLFFAVGSIIGRPIFGHVSDHWPARRLEFYQFSFLCIAVANTLVTLATSFAALATYAFIVGSMDGVFWSLMVVITHDIVGTDQLHSAFGWLLMILSFPGMLGPPMAGWLFSISHSYQLPFLISGGLVVLSTCLLFAIPTPQFSPSKSAYYWEVDNWESVRKVGEKIARRSRDSRLIELTYTITSESPPMKGHPHMNGHV